MILATFDLQITPMPPTKFQVNWPFGAGEAKNSFSRRRPNIPKHIGHNIICIDDDINKEIKEEWHTDLINKSLLLLLEYGML